MNNAKKILKNQGIASDKRGRRTESALSTKNLVLLIIGVLVMLVLCLGVCYIELRPRPVLAVEGQDASGRMVTKKVNYKESLYDIYSAETQYNSMEYLYTQIYGSTYWDVQNLDASGRNGSQLVKKEIMDAMKQREILCMEAEKMGISLSDEEKTKVDQDVKTFRDGLSDAQKKMDGLDEKTVRKVLTKQALAEKCRDQVISGLGIDEEALKAEVSKKDFRQYTLQYYMFSKNEDSETGEEEETKKSDDAIKEGREAMELLQRKAAKAEDFTKDMITDNNNDNTDDANGIVYATEDLLETDTEFMSKKARKKVKAMKNGDVSDIIETSDAIYVVKMVNNNDPAAYNEECTQRVENEKESKFNQKYKNEIKINYTAKAQKYWKSRVTVGYITYDQEAMEQESAE